MPEAAPVTSIRLCAKRFICTPVWYYWPITYFRVGPAVQPPSTAISAPVT
jgi:hypothetical protein